MAADFQFCEDNGAAGGNPSRGLTSTSGISNFNLKNIDDVATVYSTVPITANTNSFSKYIWGLWTGSYNSISTVKWQHTGGNFGAGLSLFCDVSGSGFYATPTISTVANFTRDLTSTGAISTGLVVLIGGTGQFGSGHAASSTANPCFSDYIGVQLRTTSAANAGNTVEYSHLLQFLEN